MQRWRAMPHVHRWYGADEPNDMAWLESEYGPCIDGSDPTEPYVIVVDEREVGYVQTYLIEDHPDYAACMGIEERAAGVDVFIGEPNLVHRGLGPRIIDTFLRDVVFADPRVECCVIGPEPKNTAAIRAYEKAGFRYLKTIQVPGEPEPEHIMRITRAEHLARLT